MYDISIASARESRASDKSRIHNTKITNEAGARQVCDTQSSENNESSFPESPGVTAPMNLENKCVRWRDYGLGRVYYLPRDECLGRRYLSHRRCIEWTNTCQVASCAKLSNDTLAHIQAVHPCTHNPVSQ